ncbi:hypothetical protein [Synechococcus sp. UW105]|jgi:hypothetical protein|uniref:hypothetical protein n=1 Tax=Synechococcus sp. UW105 TaxID=337067 RepID=UPI0010BDE77E|nr:hypothetical protein [Synechococcus sp. UW105]
MLNHWKDDQSMKVFLLLTGFLLALPAQAQPEEIEPYSYWFGFTGGAASTACQLAKAGLIDDEVANGFLSAYIESTVNDSDTRKYENVLRQAIAKVRENPDCKNLLR